MQERGVTIHHNASLERMEKIGDEVEYELSYPDGSKEVIRVEKALLSIGRIPNIENYPVDVYYMSVYVSESYAIETILRKDGNEWKIEL